MLAKKVHKYTKYKCFFKIIYLNYLQIFIDTIISRSLLTLYMSKILHISLRTFRNIRQIIIDQDRNRLFVRWDKFLRLKYPLFCHSE